jgi:hypothetical protein
LDYNSDNDTDNNDKDDKAISTPMKLPTDKQISGKDGKNCKFRI